MRKKCKLIISVTIMLILIIDSNTARSAAYEGLELCIRSVIPSLFPLILLSAIINRYLRQIDPVFIRPICRLCKTSANAASYILLGLFGGYPVGAKSINDAYVKGNITKAEGHRLLGFCNNAGPAFIFGIIGPMFPERSVAWGLWGIHIASALLVGFILPPLPDISTTKTISPDPETHSMINSIKTMSVICTWVIVFKMLLVFLEKLVFSNITSNVRVLLSGFLELTNGSIQLNSISNLGLRFILSSIFLGFGGICVTMQTISVTKDIGYGMYFIGKLSQTLLSFILSYILQPLYFTNIESLYIGLPFKLFCISLIFIFTAILFRKKIVAFLDKMMYTISRN